MAQCAKQCFVSKHFERDYEAESSLSSLYSRKHFHPLIKQFNHLVARTCDLASNTR